MIVDSGGGFAHVLERSVILRDSGKLKGSEIFYGIYKYFRDFRRFPANLQDS